MPGAHRPIVEVRDLLPDEIPSAVSVLARGMRDNPLNVAAFGDDPETRLRSLERLFGALLRVPTQTPLVALEGETLVGVTGVAPPGTCQPTVRQGLRFLPVLISLGARRSARLNRWTRTWRARDLEKPHSHLGPLAVDAHMQGRGIGTQILREYCRRLDQARLTGYLETDKQENVTLYQRHAFDVIGEEAVLGVPNWFMRRVAQSTS